MTALAAAPPTEVALDERDGFYLRQAIAMARKARDRGNRPFGAVIVAPDGRRHRFGNGTGAPVAFRIADKATPFAAYDPDVLQLFEAFRLPADRDTCEWEPW